MAMIHVNRATSLGVLEEEVRNSASPVSFPRTSGGARNGKLAAACCFELGVAAPAAAYADVGGGATSAPRVLACLGNTGKSAAFSTHSSDAGHGPQDRPKRSVMKREGVWASRSFMRSSAVPEASVPLRSHWGCSPSVFFADSHNTFAAMTEWASARRIYRSGATVHRNRTVHRQRSSISFDSGARISHLKLLSESLLSLKVPLVPCR
jgi:hypothetical protein